MTRTTFVSCIVAVVTCAGCGPARHAESLITPESRFSLPDYLLWSDASATRQGIQCVELRMHDGTMIDGWVLPSSTRPAKGTMVLLHGINESKASWPYHGIAERLARKGYDVVLPDLRAHGDSGGKYITYGVQEKFDIKALINDLKRQGLVEGDIFVFGVNYGADVALQYAAIDQRVAGVMAVEPHSDFRSYAYQSLAHRLGPDEIEDVIEQAGEIANFDVDLSSSVTAVAKISCPLLLVHGLLDTSAPAEGTRRIFMAAKEPKELRTLGEDQLEILPILEDWIADEMDKIARTKPRQGD